MSGRWIQNWSECKVICKNFNKSLSVLSIPFVSVTDFCNGDSDFMCTSTCPGPDCIDLTGIQLRGKYTHLCFLSVVVKGTIYQYTQCVHITFLCVVCNSSYNFLMHTIYCCSFLLSLPLNRHCSYGVVSHTKGTEVTELTLLFTFPLKWLSKSWNKSGEHQNHMTILSKK